MFSSIPGIRSHTGGFPLHNLPFSKFIPKLYNLCVDKIQMSHGLIMPGRAFCSDGSQGMPSPGIGVRLSI